MRGAWAALALGLSLALALLGCPEDDDDAADDDAGDDDGGDDDGGDDDGGDDDGGDDDTGDDDEWDPADFTHVWEIGPGQDYETPCDAPWETIQADTLVRIHHRAEPYACKWVITVAATEEDPVVVLGVPAGDQRPVITGDGAATPQGLDYWNEDRSVIKIGGSSHPSSKTIAPAHIVVQGLSIRSARPAYSFTDDQGSGGTYSENAAAIHVDTGERITIRDNELHDCGNGFFANHTAVDVLVRGNHLYDNGIDGSAYHHNNYTSADGITFEFNHFGPLRAGCDGNNLKDRSAGTVIRHNWIEGGNRQLDLVDSGHQEIVDDPAYGSTFVYGNVLIEPDGAGNSQIVHYGGDSGDEAMYRKGTLHFFHNTVYSTRDGNTTLLRLSSADESADVRNNVVFPLADASHLAICTGTGTLDLRDNWLPLGWRETHETMVGTLTDHGNVEGLSPGWEDPTIPDLHLAAGSDCLGAAGPLASAAQGVHDVSQQYVTHQAAEPRPDDGDPDIGAFERP